MKIQFDANQAFQLNAVAAVTDLWKSAWTESARLRLKTDEQAKP